MQATPLSEIPVVEGKIYYLACPYGNYDPDVVAHRMTLYEEMDAELTTRGIQTMSPLDKHYKLKYRDLSGTYRFWEQYCKNMLAISCGLIVMTVHGWDTSVGICGEIEEARRLGLPIYYVDPV